MPSERYSHIKYGVVSRSKTTERGTGGNAVALAAYHACARYEHDGKVYDFTRKHREKAAETRVLLPDGAPSWAADPGELWKRAEAEGKRKDSQTARWIGVEIPREVPGELRADFAAAVAEPFRKMGMGVQIDVHCPKASDKGEQPHVHLLGTMRKFKNDGFGPKAESVDLDAAFREDGGKGMRRRIAAAANAWLEKNGVDVRINPDRRDDGISPEGDVSRAAVEAWKQQPDTADVFPTILFERKQRRRVRAEKAALAAEITAADEEILTLEKELKNARYEPADDIARPSPSRDARGDTRGTQGYAADSRTAAAPGEGRRGPDRPDTHSPRGRADEPRRATRKGRPAQRQAEDIALGRAGTRLGDDDLQQARARLRHADGRADRTRRRARERAQFASGSNRPENEERLRQARDRLHEADGRGARARRRARERAEFRGSRPDAEERLHKARRKARNASGPSVGPSAPADRLARRRRLLASLLREAYDTGWLPDSVVANIRDIRLDRAAGVVTIYLNSGGWITDTGDRITLAGRPTAAAVQELLTAADRHGWTSSGGIEVSGDVDFRRGVAIELMSRRPPVVVTGLDDSDKAEVAEALQQRQRDRRRAALDALTKAERVAAEAYNLRPNGRRETEVLAAVRDAQAAVSDNDDNAIDAAMTGDIPSAMRAGMAWRQRITPQAPAVDMTIEPDAPGLTPAPAYLPPWIRDPTWKPDENRKGA